MGKKTFMFGEEECELNDKGRPTPTSKQKIKNELQAVKYHLKSLEILLENEL